MVVCRTVTRAQNRSTPSTGDNRRTSLGILAVALFSAFIYGLLARSGDLTGNLGWFFAAHVVLLGFMLLAPFDEGSEFLGVEIETVAYIAPLDRNVVFGVGE